MPPHYRKNKYIFIGYENVVLKAKHIFYKLYAEKKIQITLNYDLFLVFITIKTNK